MPPPALTAEATLYPSTLDYPVPFVGAGSAALHRGRPCQVVYDQCVSTANADHDFRTFQCSLRLPNTFEQQQCYRGAEGWYQSDLTACREWYLCNSADDCKQSPVAPGGFRCCPPGTQACGTDQVPYCQPECPPGKIIPLNAPSCTCVCDPSLPPCEMTSAGFQKTRDPASCACVCPNTCPPTFVPDPHTCRCTCPKGYHECKGVCVLLGTRENCGRCGDQCANNQDCCGDPPQCVDIRVDPNCGACGINCRSRGQTCCGPSPHHCSSLNTNSECGACGRACKPPKTCQQLPSGGYDCVCPANSSPCGPDLCCTSPKTGCRIGSSGVYECACPSGVAECGSSCCGPGEQCLGGQCCRLGDVLCAGQCCPSARCCGTFATGRTCCPVGQVCCGGKCCSAAACCSGTCEDILGDEANCGGCGIQCPSGTTVFGGASSPWAADCLVGTCHCPWDRFPCGGQCYQNWYPDGSGRLGFCCPPGSGLFSGGYSCPQGTRCCTLTKSDWWAIEYNGCCPV